MNITNSTKTTIFADGVENIGLIGGVVRTDFFQVQLEDSQAAPSKELSGQLIMSPDGFGRTLQSMIRLYNELKAKGLVKEEEVNVSD